MDHGTLTDNNGRKADFRNVIIIMTTNAGAETMQKSVMGFTTQKQAGDEMADIKRLFTPEFRNRLDAIVSFKPLDEQIILRVVDKFLLQLEQQLAEKKVEVTFTDKLRKHLAAKGFDPAMGARPMQRLIQDTIRRSLATNCCLAAWSMAVASKWTGTPMLTKARAMWCWTSRHCQRPRLSQNTRQRQTKRFATPTDSSPGCRFFYGHVRQAMSYGIHSRQFDISLRSGRGGNCTVVHA